MDHYGTKHVVGVSIKIPLPRRLKVSQKSLIEVEVKNFNNQILPNLLESIASFFRLKKYKRTINSENYFLIE